MNCRQLYMTQNETAGNFRLKSETAILLISIAEGNPKGERKREKRVVAATTAFRSSPLAHDFASRKV